MKRTITPAPRPDEMPGPGPGALAPTSLRIFARWGQAGHMATAVTARALSESTLAAGVPSALAIASGGEDHAA